MLFCGCYSTHNVTSYSDHYSEILKTRSALSDMGYELSGEDTRTDNNVYVSAVSYSTQTGYGSAMNNKYVTTDRYTFTNKDGNTMSYCVSYELYRSYDSILYVTNVSVPQCETSNPKDYTKLCGYSSPIRDVTQLPQNTPVKIYDSVGTYVLSYTIILALALGVICIVGSSY